MPDEAASRESEKRYRSLFQHMLEGYAHCRMVFDHAGPRDFIYLDVNAAFERITGLKNVVGKKVTEVIPGIKTSSPELFEIYGRVAATGKPEQFETYVEALEKWFGITAYQHGKDEFVAVFEDITARKRAEVTLRESEERYRTVVESANEAIVTIDRNSRIILFANNCVERIFGYSAAELVGQELTVLMPARFRENNKAAVKRYAEADVNRIDLRVVKVTGLHKNGQEIPLEVSYGEYAKAGRLHIVAIIRDVTELGRAEEALRLFRMLIDRSNDLVEVVDPESGRFLDVNERACLELGYSRDEFLALRVPDVDPMVDGDSFARSVDTLRKSGGLRWEGLHRRKNGSTFPVEVSISLSRLDREYAVAVVRDMTEVKNLQKQFAQAQKMEAVGRLAGGVAHDFNNLLTVINGTAELASLGLKTGDPLHTDLQEILQAGRRAAGLTRQLLAFSRKQILQPTVLSLNAVIGGMQGMLQRLLGEDVTLQFVPAEGLGSVKADAGQIEQVIMNLAVNARDAMPAGGMLSIATRNVELDDEYAKHHPYVVPGPQVMISVTDTGVGMDAATQARLFEPFFTTKPAGKGTGLGLATVYGIVKQSGGSVAVYSELGRGTTFKIYLPRVQEVAHEGQAARPTTIATGTETILAVEDDTPLRDLAKRVLRSAGYTVLTASNGGEALLLLEKHPGTVDLLLTDLVMPGMSGRDLAARLMQLRPQMKVLHMSGYTDDAILQHGVLDEATHFIHKPYSPAELARKVREVLDTKGDRRAKG